MKHPVVNEKNRVAKLLQVTFETSGKLDEGREEIKVRKERKKKPRGKKKKKEEISKSNIETNLLLISFPIFSPLFFSACRAGPHVFCSPFILRGCLWQLHNF